MINFKSVIFDDILFCLMNNLVFFDDFLNAFCLFSSEFQCVLKTVEKINQTVKIFNLLFKKRMNGISTDEMFYKTSYYYSKDFQVKS